MMKKNIYKKGGWLLSAALLTFHSLLFTSCNDWLSVQPNSQVESDELFSDERGYKESLAGVYSSMVSSATYAKEMTFGAMGVLAHEWVNYPSASYGDMPEYDYSGTVPTNITAAIWQNNYNAIANANNILAHIDADKQVFTANNYNIIKGEALALRAFLHFDLLRCFGVSCEVNASMPAIPYVTVMSYEVSPQLTVREVAQKVIDDLNAAEELLRVDPILTGEEISEMTDNGYLMNRQMHLNYYAVKGLQARVYMWTKEYDKALAAANVVINSEAFPWADYSMMMNGEDNSLATEQLFALNNVNLQTLADTYFNVEYSSSNFSLDQQNLQEYYDNQTADYRYLYLFRNSTYADQIDYRYLQKFTPSGGDSYYTNKMPLLRVAEMYLIKAECDFRSTGSGLAALNALRAARNVPALDVNPDDFYSELVREYRRELIGEGQLFFLYKRLNRESIIGTDADVVALKGYTFPLPQSETTAAQRQANR